MTIIKANFRSYFKALRILDKAGITRKSGNFKYFLAVAEQLIEDGYLDKYVEVKLREIVVYKTKLQLGIL